MSDADRMDRSSDQLELFIAGKPSSIVTVERTGPYMATLEMMVT
jgi:hypothetical protein